MFHPPLAFIIQPIGGHGTVLLPDVVSILMQSPPADTDVLRTNPAIRHIKRRWVSTIWAWFTINFCVVLIVCSRICCFVGLEIEEVSARSWCLFYVNRASQSCVCGRNGHDPRPFRPPIDPRHYLRQWVHTTINRRWYDVGFGWRPDSICWTGRW